MNRAELPCLAALFLVSACGDSSSVGEASSATTSASSSTTASSTAATTTSGDTATSTGAGGAGTASGGGAGDGGATTGTGSGAGGAGGAGGAPPEGPTPAECFAIHDEAECFAAGCNRFLGAPRALSVEEGLCSADRSLGYCFLEDPRGGGSAAPASYVRDFEGEGPRVLGLSGEFPLLGWTPCDEEIAVTVPECCCWALMHPVCAGITPIPLD